MALKKESARDITRMAVQTMVPGTATYMLMNKLEFPHLSWAIISALFTIYLSADSTLRAGLGRFAGAVLGLLLGLLSVELAGGEGTMLLRLVSTTAVTNAMAVVWPNLSYSTVVAAFIALYPDPEIAGALELAAAILIGAGIGTASAWLAWPEWGRQRAIRLICKAFKYSP